MCLNIILTHLFKTFLIPSAVSLWNNLSRTPLQEIQGHNKERAAASFSHLNSLVLQDLTIHYVLTETLQCISVHLPLKLPD